MKDKKKVINWLIVLMIWAVTVIVVAMSLLSCSTYRKTSKKDVDIEKEKKIENEVTVIDSIRIVDQTTLFTDTVEVVVTKYVTVYDTNKAYVDSNGNWSAPVSSQTEERMELGKRTRIEESDSILTSVSTNSNTKTETETASISVSRESSEVKFDGKFIAEMIAALVIGFAAGIVFYKTVLDKFITKLII